MNESISNTWILFLFFILAFSIFIFIFLLKSNEIHNYADKDLSHLKDYIQLNLASVGCFVVAAEMQTAGSQGFCLSQTSNFSMKNYMLTKKTFSKIFIQ